MKRNSGLEVYRILAMVLIVANHFSTHGALRGDILGAPLYNAYFAKVLACGGKLGVDMFVLISSYFLSARTVRPSSLLITWLKTVFGGSLIFLVLTVLNLPVEGKFADAVLPVLRYNYWFVSCYLVLAILSPFLVVMLRGLGERRHRWLLVFLLVFFSVCPTFLHLRDHVLMCFHTPMVWFVVLFVLGAYLRYYVQIEKVSRRKVVWVLLIATLAVLVWILICELVARFGHHTWKWQKIRDMNSIFMVTISTCALVFFAQMRTWRNQWVNRIAACTFGVYLIHSNRSLNLIIWDRMLGVKSTVGCGWFVPFALASSLAVYAGCTFLEFVRQMLMWPLENWMRTRLAGIDEKVRMVFE